MQQYSFLLPALFIVWIVLIAARIGAYMDAKHRKNNPEPFKVPEKSCPPHLWRWEEQPGMENTNYLWCLTCGKTPRQVSEGN